MVVVINDGKSPEESIKILDFHLLVDRAKRGDNVVWLEFTFELIKTMRASRNQEMAYEAAMNDLMTRISKLEDIQTSSESSADVMVKATAAVRGSPTLLLVSGNQL